MIADTEALLTEVARLQRENEALRQQLGSVLAEPMATYGVVVPELPLESPSLPGIGNAASVQEKIVLFRSLFRGREDVHAIHWVNERTGKKG